MTLQFSSPPLQFVSIDIIFSLSSFAIGMSNYFRFFLRASLASKNKLRKTWFMTIKLIICKFSVLWLFSSSLKSFCCLLCELLSKYLNGSGLIAGAGRTQGWGGLRNSQRDDEAPSRKSRISDQSSLRNPRNAAALTSILSSLNNWTLTPIYAIFSCSPSRQFNQFRLSRFHAMLSDR